MIRIGLISDTHGWIHPSLKEHFSGVDEIWHAGDIGGIDTADKFASMKPLRAVYGNIDDAMVRRTYPEHLHFETEGIKVWMTHIGGYPGNYDRRVMKGLLDSSPDLFICGHSHIARIQKDHKSGFLYVNPGAAGFQGFHKYITAARFCIQSGKIIDMELIELGERGKVILPS